MAIHTVDPKKKKAVCILYFIYLFYFILFYYFIILLLFIVFYCFFKFRAEQNVKKIIK